MRRLAIIIPLLMLAGEASAISRYQTNSMSCARVQAAVTSDGEAILRYPAPDNPSLQLYDRYVRDRTVLQREPARRFDERTGCRHEQVSGPQMRACARGGRQSVVSEFSIDAVDRRELLHACRGEVWIDEQACLVGEAEHIGVVHYAARGFHAADHAEMILEAVQPGEKHDARLVELRRRLEDFS